MIKKLAILGAILLPSLIWAAPSAPSPFNGLYVGGELGMLYGLFDHTSSSVITSGSIYPNSPTNASTDYHASNLGAAVGLHLGYGHVFNHLFYLGAEINGDLQTVSVNSHGIVQGGSSAETGANNTFTGRLTNAYGITLRPGYLLTPTLMVYLKGGVQATHLQGSSTTGYDPTSPVPAPPVFSTTVSGSKNVVGWLAGFGIEKRAANHFGFRAEDLISGYGGMNASLSQTGTLGSGFTGHSYALTNSTHITPFANTIMVGVDYFFS